jgi:hypothetical protein
MDWMCNWGVVTTPIVCDMSTTDLKVNERQIGVGGVVVVVFVLR